MSVQGHFGVMAINSRLAARQRFLRLTYSHLTAAIAGFVGISAFLYSIGFGEQFARALAGSRFAWLLVLGGFTIVASLASGLARSEAGPATQYLGLAIYTIIEAVIFAPLIYIAAAFAPGVLPTAAAITLFTFGALTAYVLISKADFSFLRLGLWIGGIIALGLIACAVIFGLELGTWFSLAMILFSVGVILYKTSQVLHEYRPDQYVAAALGLFAAVVLLFWYVIRLLMGSRR